MGARSAPTHSQGYLQSDFGNQTPVRLLYLCDNAAINFLTFSLVE